MNPIPGVESLKPSTSHHIRLGIVGAPGTRKTMAAATFPDPHFLEIENTLDNVKDAMVAYDGIDISTIKRIKFFDDAWVEDYLRNTMRANLVHIAGSLLNRRDAIKHWLLNYAKLIPDTSTLVLDTWTTLQIYFDMATTLQPSITKQGGIDEFAFWAKKIEYSEEVMSALERLKCNVVVLFHESQVRDPNSGALLDKVQPVMQGKFVTYIKKYFPNYWRSLCLEIKGTDNKPIVDPKSGKIAVNYVWQTSSDRNFDAKCSLVGLDMYVKSSYKNLFKQV